MNSQRSTEKLTVKNDSSNIIVRNSVTGGLCSDLDNADSICILKDSARKSSTKFSKMTDTYGKISG